MLRALARLVTLVLLAALAAAGAATAIFAIGGDDNAVSIPALARYFHLPELRETIGDFLSRLEADGPIAWWSVAGGAIAVAFGILLLVGVLMPRRERVVVLEDDESGRLAARRRPLSRAAEALAEQQRGVTEARARVRPRRRGRGGRLRVAASRTRVADAEAVNQAMAEALAPLAEAGLQTRVRSKLGRGQARVQ